MMTDKPKRWQSWVVYTIVLSITLAVVYFLSIGPVYWIYWKGYISGTTFRMLLDTVYAPHTWCHANLPLFGGFIDKYIQLWRPF